MTPPQYLVARLRTTLAEDPRTAEQGVRVTVRGEHIVVSGDVATEQRRTELSEVIRDMAPDMVIHNDVRVVPAGEPTRREELT
ncbi:phospholipid-binding protein [Kibdelosporangium phytohabitans]|uniref:Phospholipid-binding protein n=1 Tax=Kibdelosporangium phytohabitans TaxID=860235 RepID=A0A0N9I9E7_9PSEU|nr:BON domain-containing protein [Kibdelosporangium phytohabitans]ALG11346.1 phospholipid-binding protein [Kibdelosporangium phytohabitans]